MNFKRDFFDEEPDNRWDWNKLLEKEGISTIDKEGRIEYWKEAEVKINEEELENM